MFPSQSNVKRVSQGSFRKKASQAFLRKRMSKDDRSTYKIRDLFWEVFETKMRS